MEERWQYGLQKLRGGIAYHYFEQIAKHLICVVQFGNERCTVQVEAEANQTRSISLLPHRQV